MFMQVSIVEVYHRYKYSERVPKMIRPNETNFICPIIYIMLSSVYFDKGEY